MNDSTWVHYLEKTLREVADHPHREELIKLINEQVEDDTNTVKQVLRDEYYRQTVNA